MSRKTTQIWMSLHIITLGKAGSAASVWDVIVGIASLRKGAAVTLVAENTQPGDAGPGLISLPLGDALFQVSWKQNKGSGIRKQMQMLCWNVMRPWALCCGLRPWAKLWTGWGVLWGAWICFYMVRCLLKGKLRHNSTGDIALYTFHSTLLYPLPLYI